MTKTLITGGTGSLGQALTRFLLETTDDQIIVFSRDEVKQADMHDALKSNRVSFLLGDVRDVNRLNLACSGVSIVLHTAALKRVDSVAKDPDEVFKTNVLGTRNVLHAAHQQGARKVLLISTDKACYPINAYGLSKAMAEWLVTSYNTYGYPDGLRSSVIRYGNVLYSRGSFLHGWNKQAQIELTANHATRFLLSLSDAVTYISQAVDLMYGGEIFVPMLYSATLETIAEAVYPEKSRIVVGWRPGGEKLHETLLTEEESARAVWCLMPRGRVAVVPPFFHSWTRASPYAGYDSVSEGEWTSDLINNLMDVERTRRLVRVAHDAEERHAPCRR